MWFPRPRIAKSGFSDPCFSSLALRTEWLWHPVCFLYLTFSSEHLVNPKWMCLLPFFPTPSVLTFSLLAFPHPSQFSLSGYLAVVSLPCFTSQSHLWLPLEPLRLLFWPATYNPLPVKCGRQVERTWSVGDLKTWARLGLLLKELNNKVLAFLMVRNQEKTWPSHLWL